MQERYTRHSEYMSELYTLRNALVAQIAEIDMAIMRENNNPSRRNLRLVTAQSREVINLFKRQKSEQEPLPTAPNYENLLQ